MNKGQEMYKEDGVSQNVPDMLDCEFLDLGGLFQTFEEGKGYLCKLGGELHEAFNRS